MTPTFKIKLPLLALLALALQPTSLWACAACYGQSDSPLAQGMNWGILSLLGTIALVLGGVSAFFVYLARRSAAVSAAAASGQAAETPVAGLSTDLQAEAL